MDEHVAFSYSFWADEYLELGEIDAGGVIGTAEYARSEAAVKNFVTKDEDE